MEPRRGASRNAEGTSPWSPGITRGAMQRRLGGPGVEPWGRVWSPGNTDGAAPWSLGDRDGASSCGSDKSNSSTFQPGRQLAAASWAPGPLCVYNLPPGRALVLQGPGDGGTRRVSLHRSGVEGVLCGVDLGPFSPGRPTGPKPPGSRTPTLQGAGWTLGGFHRIFCHVPATLFSQRHLPNSRHYYFIQGTPVLAGRAWQEALRSLRGEKGPREGKEEEAAATPCKKFREPPRTRPPSLPGQNPSNLLAFPAGSSRNSPLDVPLNKTIRSKTRKPRLLWSHPSLPPDPSFAGVRGCRVRTCDPLPLGGERR